MPSGKRLFLRFIRFRPIGGNDKRRFRFVYAIAEPVWMNLFRKPSKVGNTAVCKIFARNTLRPKDARKISHKTAQWPDLASYKSPEILSRTKRNLSIPNPVKSYICIKIAITKCDFCTKIVNIKNNEYICKKD